MEPDGLLQLIDLLNPENDPGRLTLITRFGHDKVAEHLPQLIRAVEREGKKVVWSCDPMHATRSRSTATRPGRSSGSCPRSRAFSRSTGRKARHPGGIHVEMTGKNVTECTGGARTVTAEDLSDRYHTHCDPRLNADQALELAFLRRELMKGGRDQDSRVAAIG